MSHIWQTNTKKKPQKRPDKMATEDDFLVLGSLIVIRGDSLPWIIFKQSGLEVIKKKTQLFCGISPILTQVREALLIFYYSVFSHTQPLQLSPKSEGYVFQCPKNLPWQLHESSRWTSKSLPLQGGYLVLIPWQIPGSNVFCTSPSHSKIR